MNHFQRRQTHPHRRKPNPAEKAQFNADLESFTSKNRIILDHQELIDLSQNMPPNIAQIPCLSYTKGSYCRLQKADGTLCQRCTTSLTSPFISTHMKLHVGKKPHFDEGTLQRLCEGSSYFHVDPFSTPAPKGDPFQSWRKSISDKDDLEEKIYRKAGIDPLDRRTVTTFETKTGWRKRANKYSIPGIIALVALPKPKSGDVLLRVRALASWWITSISSKELESVDPIYLRQLNDWKKHACVVLSFEPCFIDVLTFL